ncbi:Alpha/Beta hydrolase protein [Xylariales sp. PMI_506]|nr:Alpha/Beta hydrolase protein [Xylariales sp. PMI_506]
MSSGSEPLWELQVDIDLKVTTNSGVLTGFVNLSVPDVRQFLGIPFAQPPIGSRRWLPPSRLQSNTSVNATNIGPGCPQLGIATLPSQDVYSPTGGGRTEFFPLETFSEDCLTLNVWAPRGLKSDLPVFVWYFGGGFVRGGTNSLYLNPQSWVQRTQEHIVVTVNFRSNIFGFPNADELMEQNLGLRDQRLALEWVRDNIAKFGGDPSKIIAWGQSGGAIAIDYLNFAYFSDPIVSGMILESGTALFPKAAARTFDTDRTNFTAVAVALGCGDGVSQIECLRNISWEDIEAVIKEDSTLSFLPIVDDNIVYSNYTQRYQVQGLSPAPAIIGINQHEFNEAAPLGPLYNQSTSDKATNSTFLCTAAHTSRLRQSNSQITYRYRYDGNFSNISPPIYPGAYHAAELPLLFGTAGDYHGPSTSQENRVSQTMQDLWLEFAQDPENGLRKVGWGPYSEGKAALLVTKASSGKPNNCVANVIGTIGNCCPAP